MLYLTMETTVYILKLTNKSMRNRIHPVLILFGKLPLFTIQITFPVDASLCSICYNTIFGPNQLSKHLFYTCLCLIFHFILKVQRMIRTPVFVMINSFLHIFSSFLIMDKYKVIQFTTHSILCFALFQNPQKQYEVR